MEKKEHEGKGIGEAGKAVPEKKMDGDREDPNAEKRAGQEPKKDELEEARETLQRVQADFENSRKRIEREKLDFALFANASLVKELLPLLDSIEAAERHLKEQGNVSRDDALKGMELVKRQLLAVLRAHGLSEIECVGQKFDPMVEDCVLQGKDGKKGDDVVLEELQKGYALNGRVLRHAKVKVNKL